MSTTNSTRPREIEHHVVRQLRKLDEPSLLRLLAELRNLTAEAKPA